MERENKADVGNCGMSFEYENYRRVKKIYIDSMRSNRLRELKAKYSNEFLLKNKGGEPFKKLTLLNFNDGTLPNRVDGNEKNL